MNVQPTGLLFIHRLHRSLVLSLLLSLPCCSNLLLVKEVKTAEGLRGELSVGPILMTGDGVPLSYQTRTDQNLTPIEVARVATYCEGPVFDRDGNLYISHGRFITRLTPDGQKSIWAETGGPNGHKILADDTHLVCDYSRRAVLHLGADGQVLGKAASDCGGKPLRAPNDMTLDPSGGYYFTDPGPFEEAQKQAIGRVCFVDAEGKTHLVAEDLWFPNGIVLRASGDTLLVAEDMRNRILEYEVISPGKVKPAKVFADLPPKDNKDDDYAVAPDGMALDELGRLYVAHYGMEKVQVFDTTGRLEKNLPAGNLSVSNLAFGGPEMDQLYITGSPGGFDDPGVVYRLDLKGTRGLTILPPRK